MGTLPAKTLDQKPSEAELIAQMEQAGPSRAKLRRLVKKHPAPQEWYDQADSPPQQRRK